MSLSEHERAVLSEAGSASAQHVRGQAVAIVLAKSGDDLAEARALLAGSFAATVQPSFHLIPRGDAMTSEAEFDSAYAVLSKATDTNPTVIVEAKIGEDGGTVRDKAARLKNLAVAGGQRGLVVCAVIDGKGWTERLNALVDVVIATGGRTYTLQTLEHILEVPEIGVLRGTAAQAD